MKRLNLDSIGALPAGIVRPDKRVLGAKPGIVHLGVGAFHRAHQAVMTEAAMLAGDAEWGIVAASLRSPGTRDALMPQDGLYTLAVRDASGERLQVIGVIRDLLVGPEDPERLVAAMADPAIRIVSLTVTEKGYCHDPATGLLDERHPDIVHDLAHPEAPRSAPGYIIAALRRRRMAGVAPFTVLCCDNLPSNGRTVHRVLTRMAELIDPAFGRFVAGEVACPSTMVDRIVPATSDEDLDRVSAALGLVDAWPVMAEPFTQWVIEDRFALGRPRWEAGGAQFVSDVAPFEVMKLRMLNGAHSSLAYLGTLAGLTFVADAATDRAFVRFLSGLWSEVASTLPSGAGLEPLDYAANLLERFRNPALKHRLIQIAMDGSQKVPQRLLGTLRQRRAAGQSCPHLSFAVAGFLRFMTGSGETAEPLEIRDPMAALFAAATQAGGDRARAMLGIAAVFGDLDADETASEAISAAFERINRLGVRAAMAELA
ncbi:MAG: mannitol dehydrogenase family protein [Hyphomicrobiales bacterium]|nr:mannitol dehydrogenase family protein [Hyphomicrobiales bacterium]